MAIPSFSNSPWIRGAPQRQFSAAIRRIRFRQDESMRGLPGRREQRRQHRRTPSRSQRSTVAGWISTSATRHLGQNHRKNSQNRRSVRRKRLFERARTPSWWRRARVSSRRSRRGTRADRTAAPVLMATRTARRVPAGDANVNDFWPASILARHTYRAPPKVGRNEPCPCGSGKKFKKCCGG
jgi:alpha-beta hydrolase superfamily lysophospholipase